MKTKPLEHDRKIVIDKYVKDLGIETENELKQNYGLVLNVVTGEKYKKFRPLLYIKTKKVAFFNVSNSTVYDKIPNLPVVNKVVLLPAITS